MCRCVVPKHHISHVEYYTAQCTQSPPKPVVVINDSVSVAYGQYNRGQLPEAMLGAPYCAGGVQLQTHKYSRPPCALSILFTPAWDCKPQRKPSGGLFREAESFDSVADVHILAGGCNTSWTVSKRVISY